MLKFAVRLGLVEYGVALSMFCASTLISYALPEPFEETKIERSETGLLALDRQGREFEVYTESHALLIGQSSYGAGGWAQLPAVKNELTRLRAALERNNFHVKSYLDLKAEDVVAVIERFFLDYGYNKESRLVVYYAGHGFTRTDRIGNESRQVGYLVSVGVPAPNPEGQFLTNSIRMSRFIEWAMAAEAKHILFIFDSCFSGTILGHRGPALPADYVVSDIANKRVREFLTAGTANQTVPAESIFTRLLAAALNGERSEADINRDGFLTGSELVTFLKGWVPYYNERQTPDSGRLRDPFLDAGDIIFRLPGPEGIARFGPADSSGVLPGRAPIVLSPSQSGAGTTLALAVVYEAEALKTTGDHWCSRCTVDVTGHYEIELNIPAGAPPDSVLGDPMLQCVSGGWACEGRLFHITQPPELSVDKKNVRARFDFWGTPSTWRLSAKVLVPVMVLPVAVKSIASTGTAPTEEVAVVDATPPIPQSAADALRQITPDLQSEDPEKRNQAGKKLIPILESNAAAVEQVVRGIPNGTAEYRQAVIEALANAQNLPDAKAAKDILSITASKTIDDQFRAQVNSVIKKFGHQ
jgi:hypothetical protein